MKAISVSATPLSRVISSICLLSFRDDIFGSDVWSGKLVWQVESASVWTGFYSFLEIALLGVYGSYLSLLCLVAPNLCTSTIM